MSSPTATEKSKTAEKDASSNVGKTINEANLHDFLALGDIERGLSQNGNRHAMQEIERLPLFLRVLSLTRPQASISVLGRRDESQQSGGGDELVNTVVERLEDVVAKHSVAEGVDVMTCHLAPSLTRKLSKVPPLKRKKSGKWATKELAAVARNPRSIKRRRKAGGDDGGGESKKGTDDGIQESSEDEEMEEDTANQLDKKQRKGQNRRGSLEVAAEDSQEATAVKTLSELASLVVTSLEPINDKTDTDETGGKKTGISLTIDDSILSESGAGAAESGGGAMEGSDLGSTVAAIMHHAPVLRSRQVANALCRASIPQGGKVMSRMGANCPASVPSLLLGCIEAYSMAVAQGSISVANVAKQSVSALAKLSTRECYRVMTKLQASNIMLDVQLKLSMETDPTAAACLIISNLTNVDSCTLFESDRMTNADEVVGGTQPPGDTSSDFRALEEIDDNLISSTSAKEPSLMQLLSTDSVLCKDTLDFLSKDLVGFDKDGEKGQLCLLLRALSMLMLVPSRASSKFNPRQYIAGSILQLLIDLVEKTNQNILLPMDIPESSMYDNLVDLIRCCSLLVIAKVIEEGEVSTEISEKCINLVKLSKNLPCVSRRSAGFAYCLHFAMHRKASLGLFTHVVNMLSGTEGQKVNKVSNIFKNLEGGLKKICDMPENGVAEEVCCDNDVSLGFALTALRLEIPDSYEQSDEALDSQVKSMLEGVLDFNTVLQGETIPRFVVEATDFLHARGKLPVPLVLSSELNNSTSKLSLVRMKKVLSSLDESRSRFLLQLLHATEFLDLDPKSPFVFDPRSFPIKEALCMINCTDYTDTYPFLENTLRKLIGKHCPEVLAQANCSAPNDELQTSMLKNMFQRDVMKHLDDSIRSCIESSNPAGDCHRVEEIFLAAKARLSDSDLFTTVVGAFLASPYKPPPKYSYSLICRDPLALFKCPMRVWRCRELRRIVLTTMSNILETNTAITMNASPLEDSADELLSARNVLVVRCLLVIASGGNNEKMPPLNCSLTISLIRSIVASQKGLVATLVKQGLDERALDLFIESVPETMNDSQDLLQLLSQQSALTAAEKLKVADAVIRIAIVNGQSNETDAATMAYTALAVLIDSFFLVVGPVGVPVNALMASDNSGLDVTQIARNAAFRILKSLQLVRGRRSRLRKESGMALQRLAGLCKGESASTGVGGAVGGRRKALLKEIFDAVMRAANSMGSSVGSSSAVA